MLPRSIKTRIQSGLMDPQFNSKNAVYRNFYECFLCTAIKFAAHCRELQRKGHQNSLNQKYIFGKKRKKMNDKAKNADDRFNRHCYATCRHDRGRAA